MDILYFSSIFALSHLFFREEESEHHGQLSCVFFIHLPLQSLGSEVTLWPE